ncbi:MAG TPA: DegT/DnrJ/EryC1/StrS family aminotransferase [Solirubrobacteraceae bacterium]|nr:DegT/DnrJ/EryC1/StrS family aminotransferase [Solirubrobacteraceae bacterium]
MTTADARVPLTVMDNHDPELMQELMETVGRVAESAAFIGGPFVESFESAFASYCEATHAIGVSSGTEALILALRALQIEPGDEVIVPANSFVATAEAVWLAGGRPRFADVDPETQLMTPATLEDAYDPRVRGVIPVHLFGRTAEMAEILSKSREWGIWVVEDCAQAQGARYAERPVGTWGDAGTFSFYPAKNLGAWGDAGAVVTNRADVAERIRLLRSHGEKPRYNHRMIGTTGRLDGLQAAVLERKLALLEDWNAQRRRIAASLHEATGGLEHIALPPRTQAPADHVYHQYVVRTEKRDALRAHLDAAGIDTAIHYPVPIHESEAFRALTDGRDVAPVATRLAREICSLPMFPGMSDSQIQCVADALLDFAP